MGSPFLARSIRTLRGRCRHEKYSYAFRARYAGIAGGSISIAQAAIADVTAGRTRTELGLIGAIRRDHRRAVFGGVLSDLVRFMVYRLNAVLVAAAVTSLISLVLLASRETHRAAYDAPIDWCSIGTSSAPLRCANSLPYLTNFIYFFGSRFI